MSAYLSISPAGRQSGIYIAPMVFVLAALAPGAFAQAGLGTITGTIVDQSGSAVPGARVTLVQLSTATTREVVCNQLGIFSLTSIFPGEYTLSVTSPGLRDKKLENLVINGYQELSLGQVELEVGTGPVTKVTVEAQQQLIKDSGVRTDTIQSAQVTNMPNNGRNWATLLKIIPGSTAISDQGISGREYGYYGFQDFSVNGKAITQTQVNMDGGNITDHGSDAKVNASPSLEAIEEISILTNNFTAEFGNRGGISINIVTKSGTNQFHGVAFDNLRNEDLNANSWANNFTGLPRTMYRYNYFGATLGGPVRKNKLFFFYSFEDFHQNVPGTVVQSRVPTALERAGDFSQTITPAGTRPSIYQPGSQFDGTPIPFPNNVIPASMINPMGAAITNVYPAPNNPNDPNNNYTLIYQALYPRLSQMGRVDWNVNNSTRAFFRYSDDEGTFHDKGLYNSSANLPFNMMKMYRPDRAWVVNASHVFGSNLVMEALLGWSYEHNEVTAADPDLLDPTKLGLSGLPTVFKRSESVTLGGTTLPSNLPPGINTGGVYPTFYFTRLPAITGSNDYHLAGTLTWQKGSHSIKFGGQWIYNHDRHIFASNDKGTFDFSPSHSPYDTNYGPSNVLVGAVAEFSQVSSYSYDTPLFNDFQLFAQDSWRVSHNLTLNYGLRVYHMPPEHNTSAPASKDAVFLPNLYDPRQAPRYYIPDPNNRNNVIDPANPGSPLPSNIASQLLYTLVPGSGNPLDGVYPIGSGPAGNAALVGPKPLLFAPRGGFAWAPRGDSKTVIRGGFGWAYNRNNLTDAIVSYENGLTQTVDYTATSLTTLATGIPRISPASFGARDPSGTRKAQTIYDYSISVQHQIPFQMVVDVGYVGNIQRHQAIDFNLNAIAPGTAFLPQYLDSTNAGYNFAGPVTASNPGPLPGSNAMNPLVMRPYPGLNTLTVTENVGNNRYDSLQASVNKRFGSGLMFQVVFTKGRLISGQESPGLSCCSWKTYTGYISNTSRPYTLASNYIYRIPSLPKALGFNNAVSRGVFDNWQFAHLLTFFGGQPYTPSFSIQQANTGTNINTSMVFLGTPDLAPRSTIAGDLKSTNSTLLFNPANLGTPGIYPANDGTGPRNYLLAPGTFVNDMTTTKQFRIVEGKILELRVAGYNVFNQVRRTYLNSAALYKAQGAQYSNGFALYNLPDQLTQRAVSQGANSLGAYNQYRTGVGYPNITNVQPMRIVEVSLKFRF